MHVVRPTRLLCATQWRWARRDCDPARAGCNLIERARGRQLERVHMTGLPDPFGGFSLEAIMLQSSDTSGEVEQVQIELFRKAGLRRRLRLALSLSDTAIGIRLMANQRLKEDSTDDIERSGDGESIRVRV